MKEPTTPLRALARSATLACVLAGCGSGGDDGVEREQPPVRLACLDLPDEITWFRGAASNDWSDVRLDAHNRLWLAGYADGIVGASAVEPSGNSRAVVRHLDRDGRLLWDSGALLDTPGTDVAEALLLGPDGTLIVAGRTTGAFSNAINAGQFDTFLAWSKAPQASASWFFYQSGGAGPQRPTRLALAPDGDVVVAGQDDIFIPSNYVDAWPDPFVLRLQPFEVGTAFARLQPRWQHLFGTVHADNVGGLALQAGATYVSGSVDSGPSRGMFVRKLDAGGQVAWTKHYASVPFSHIAALLPQADGTLLMAGSVHGAFGDGVWQGGDDVFVARISGEDGRVLQSWQFGTPDGEMVADMVQDSQGNLLLLGETTGAWVSGQVNQGVIDLFLLKISPTGQRLAVRQWGTAADEAARRLAVDSCGHVVAVGSSTAANQRAGLLWFWKP